MVIKAIVFDCDGTLVDSEYSHYLAYKLTLEELQHPYELTDHLKWIGTPDPLIAKLLADKLSASSKFILERKLDHYFKLCQKGLPPIAPTVNFLKELAGQKSTLGIKIAVASAAKKKHILLHLKHLGIESYMDAILSGEDDLYHIHDPEGVNKPKPYIYIQAMRELSVAPHECVVIEDSSTGAWAAVHAGCFTVVIANKYTKNHDLSHAHWRLDSFEGFSVSRFLESAEKGIEKKLLS